MNERSRIRFMDMLLWLPAALDEPRDEAEMFTIVVLCVGYVSATI